MLVSSTLVLALSLAGVDAAMSKHPKRATASSSTSTFNPLQHLGSQCPYFSAPSQYGFDNAVPTGCSITQAAYLVRHGSRYPTSGSYDGWVSLYAALSAATYTVRGPLEFLANWVPPINDKINQAEYLSGTGAQEAFDLGVKLRHLGFTPSNEPFTVWAASQQRVLDTAQYFLDGYLAGGHYNATALGSIIHMADSVNYTFANSLTPTNGCPAFVQDTSLSSAYKNNYLGPITARLQRYISGFTLTTTQVGIMMDLCGYQTEISGYSPFCALFEDHEWLKFEYAQDLNYYYGSGPGYKYSGTTFWPYLKAVTDLFVAGPGKAPAGAASIPPPLIMSFTHDNDISPLLAALGVFNESSYAPLNPYKYNPDRKWRSSYAISFAGRVALERLECVSTPTSVTHRANVNNTLPTGPHYVRVRVNDAVVPLPGCSSGPGGSCALGSFQKYVQKRETVVGDFVKTCGITFKNATSLFTAFVDPSSAQ